MKTKLPLILGGVSAVLLLGLILFGPGMEKEQPEQILWKQEFSVVEYIPAGKERRVTLKAVRESSLTRDRFFVEVPGKFAARRGSYNTRNIFTDFSKPRNGGRYKRSGDLSEYGISPESPEIRLYTSAGAKPVTIRVGKKNQMGNSFAAIDADGFQDEIVLIPSFLLERFERPLKEFRDARYVNYGTDQYTEMLKVTVQTPQGEKTFRMRQSKYKKDGIEMPKWETDSGEEIPLSLANALENTIRDIQIEEFRDAEGVSDAEAAWQKGGRDTVVAELTVKGQGVFTMRLRSGGQITKEKAALIPMQTTADAGTDFVKAQAETDIIDRLKQLEDGLQAKRDAAKQTPRPPEERAP